MDLDRVKEKCERPPKKPRVESRKQGEGKGEKLGASWTTASQKVGDPTLETTQLQETENTKSAQI